MSTAVKLQDPVPVSGGRIIRATLDGRMVLLEGQQLFKAATELQFPNGARAQLDRQIRQAKVSFAKIEAR